MQVDIKKIYRFKNSKESGSKSSVYSPEPQHNNKDTDFLLITESNKDLRTNDNSDIIDSLRKEMYDLCIQLSVQTNEFQSSQFIDDATRYIQKNKRFLYSVVSDYIMHNLSNKDDEKHADFYTNLEFVTDDLSKIQDENTRQSIIRLYDHCMLAKMQSNEFLEDDDKFQKRAGPIIHESIEAAQRNITEQFVSLIAIFTALAFLIFGGLSSFESIFSQLNSTPTCKLLMVSSIWGLGLTNLLALFFYFIFRISKTPFRKVCSEERSTLFQRYPILVLSNYVLGSLLLVSTLLYARDYIKQIVTVVSGIEGTTALKWSWGIIVFSTIVITLIATFFLFIKKHK